MRRDNHNSDETEKTRIRSEIDEQIREYLKQGGKIDVLSNQQNGTANTRGSVWGSGEDASLGE